jgi:hypothetical protein
MNQKYDLIGDIHGYANELKALLTALGYSRQDGVYRHPERKVIFLGDFIDRGPGIRETLHVVKGMVDAGAALARATITGHPSPRSLRIWRIDSTPSMSGIWMSIKMRS